MRDLVVAKTRKDSCSRTDFSEHRVSASLRRSIDSGIRYFRSRGTRADRVVSLRPESLEKRYNR